ncbi:MAG: hypothetical protein N2691_00725 [Patescibacteria group bacterium]|nr:hypothetical protein [Patescibacteria group bacterium]
MTDATFNVLNTLSRFTQGFNDGPKDLVQAGEGQEFWLHDGPALRNLKELKHALDNITEEQFAYHVTDSKNDFAAWVRGVLQDADCADELDRCKTILSTRRVLIKFLRNYK